MIDYITKPIHKINAGDKELSSFITRHDNNIDEITVQSFGEEWERFNDFSSQELESIGNEYFDIVSEEHISEESNVLDVGCGSGRWTKYISSKVKFVEAIDPSSAVIQAAKMNDQVCNVRVTQASVENIPFGDNSFDFVFSLGVLHHIPDTQSAMNACVRKLKPEGYFLVYLYYNLDNRGFLFRFLFKLANGLRSFISKMPARLKAVVCDFIATLIYFPFAKFALAIKKIAPKSYAKIPLSYYHDKSFYVMRNDSLDRFGTPLEQRFTKEQIHQMMINAGLVNIHFSDKAPFWHAIGRKK